MESTNISTTEKMIIDFILDTMNETLVHVGIEFMNFSIHFDGSDDILYQSDFISKVMRFVSDNNIMTPCVITTKDMTLKLGNIEEAQTSELHNEICDTTYFDNTNDEYEFTVPEASDVPPPEGVEVPDRSPEEETESVPEISDISPEQTKYIEDPNEPTFRTVMNTLSDIFKTGNQKKKIGEYEIMVVGLCSDTQESLYNKSQYRYIFGKVDKGTVGMHSSAFYLVFSNNIQIDDANDTQVPVDTDDYQLTMTSSHETHTIPDIDVPLATWVSETSHEKDLYEFIDWLRLMCMNIPHTPLT